MLHNIVFVFAKTKWILNYWKMICINQRRGTGSESIHPIYGHTMHGACWIITWCVYVSCDTTVTWVPVNVVCTREESC